MTEALNEVHDMMWRMVWNFVAKYGLTYGDPNDLFGVAALGFISAWNTRDAKKGALTTHVYWRVSGEFLNLLRRNRQRLQHETLTRDDIDVAESEQRGRLEGLLADLSYDAATVVRLAVDTPRDLAAIVDEFTDTEPQIRYILIQYLSGAGWDADRIRRAFAEIRQNLR